MFKKLFVSLALVSALGCHKNQQQKNSACSPDGVCTMLFASVGVHFIDKDGKPIGAENFTAINQRTNASVLPANRSINTAGYYVITDDSMRRQLSTEGDIVKVSGTNPITGQTKTVEFKLTGGCNCHVGKLSGAETIAFD